jgi:hypothetical protein
VNRGPWNMIGFTILLSSTVGTWNDKIHCIQRSFPGGTQSVPSRRTAMTPQGTIQNPDLDLERHLDGLRPEPAHPRFAV